MDDVSAARRAERSASSASSVEGPGADDEARAIDRTVIESLKDTLAEAYERGSAPVEKPAPRGAAARAEHEPLARRRRRRRRRTA